MLDVHILIHPATPRDWVRQCLDSVYEAVNRAGYPVAVHAIDISKECPQALGHIGMGRAYGYSLGTHPYVTSVDDDDWVEPDAFAVLSDALQLNSVGITTHCTTHQNGHAIVRAWRDNLRVFRRDVAESAPLHDWPVWESFAILTHAVKLGEMPVVARPVYHYRLRASNHRALVLHATDEQREQVRILKTTSPIATELP